MGLSARIGDRGISGPPTQRTGQVAGGEQQGRREEAEKEVEKAIHARSLYEVGNAEKGRR